MQRCWQRLINQAHKKAFIVAALSPLATNHFRRLITQAINEGLTLEDFTYLTEREMKNG